MKINEIYIHILRRSVLYTISRICKRIIKQGGKEEVMTKVHYISCPGMTEMRDGLELDKIEDMVLYFRRILKDRK